MSLKSHVEWLLEYYSSGFRKVQLATDVINELNIIDEAGSFHVYGIKPEITLDAKTLEHAKELTKLFLPKVKKFTKNFDSKNSYFSLEGENNEFKIYITYGVPSTCTIKVIEEAINVPAIEAQPARIELRKKYIPEGDCAPILED